MDVCMSSRVIARTKEAPFACGKIGENADDMRMRNQWQWPWLRDVCFLQQCTLGVLIGFLIGVEEVMILDSGWA